MIRKLTIILAFLTLSAPAMAQSMCNERGSFVKHLSSKYAEAPVAMGLSAEGSVLEVLASLDGTSPSRYWASAAPCSAACS